MRTVTPPQCEAEAELERVSLRLPRSEISLVDRLAAADTRTRSFVLREAIEDWRDGTPGRNRSVARAPRTACVRGRKVRGPLACWL